MACSVSLSVVKPRPRRNQFMLWDLGSDMSKQYFNAWHMCVKLAWQVPRPSHTYFVDHLLTCDFTSIRTDIFSRYCKFVKGLMTSPSEEVRVMCGVSRQDIRTATGANIALVRSETGLHPVLTNIEQVRQKLMEKVAPVPEADQWRLHYLTKLLSQRGEAFYMADEDEVVRVTSLIDSLCVN